MRAKRSPKPGGDDRTMLREDLAALSEERQELTATCEVRAQVRAMEGRTRTDDAHLQALRRRHEAST